MKNLMRYGFYCAILSVLFYWFLSAGLDNSMYKEPVKVQTEAERQKENLKVLMKSLASDLCKVDPKQELAVVSLNGEEVKCK